MLIFLLILTIAVSTIITVVIVALHVASFPAALFVVAEVICQGETN